jgi:hypothetical protein
VRSDDRHRHPGHRAGGGYDSGRKQASDAGYYDDYPRRGSERYKDYEERHKDYEERHASNRDGVGSWSDHTERRGYDDKPDAREPRDKKDYDNYSKVSLRYSYFRLSLQRRFLLFLTYFLCGALSPSTYFLFIAILTLDIAL